VTQAGSSGTPLVRKLGIRPGDRVAVLGDPGHAEALLSPLPDGATLSETTAGADLVVRFTARRAELDADLPRLGESVYPDGALWIAWPKRASGVPTDVTEDVVRELALPLGLVDVKVCAVDETWSGLKLVWRKERRAR
jgi:hypothetical protein